MDNCFTYSYYRVLKNIFQQKSPAKIQDCYDEALSLHSLEASGNSFFQIVLQLYFLLLLVSFGAGTFVAGVDAITFFRTVGKEDYDYLFTLG